MGVTAEDTNSFSEDFQCIHWREIWYMMHFVSCELKLGLIALLSAVCRAQLDVCIRRDERARDSCVGLNWNRNGKGKEEAKEL